MKDKDKIIKELKEELRDLNRRYNAMAELCDKIMAELNKHIMMEDERRALKRKGKEKV